MQHKHIFVIKVETEYKLSASNNFLITAENKQKQNEMCVYSRYPLYIINTHEFWLH